MMSRYEFSTKLLWLAGRYLTEKGWDVDFIISKSFKLGVDYDIATHLDGVVLEFSFYAMDKEYPVQTSMPITLEALKELLCDD